MKKILFIHQNFPGQFRHIAKHLAGQPDVDVRAIGREKAPGLRGVPLHRYKPHRDAAAQTHPYARTFEQAVLYGQQVLRMLLGWRAKGYRPDVIIAHPGWGETLYAKQVYPDVPLIHFCEYYYRPRGADTDFDPEFPLTEHRAAAIESRNALHLLNLEHCDLGITPTKWQYSLHPEAYRHKLRIIHEGIDLEGLQPDPNATLELPSGQVLSAGEPIVTYVARNLEPYRGFHQFMRALPKVLEQNPDCHVVVLGGDSVSYGGRPADARHWREKLLRENPMDLTRVHFLGRVDYDTYRKVLQVSKAHVYFTFPFVLSWSLLEAMACGCHVIASDTAPVREVISNQENGVLVNFFEPDELADVVSHALLQEDSGMAIRKQAPRTARDYSSMEGVHQYVRIMATVLNAQGRSAKVTCAGQVPHQMRCGEGMR
ncbi:glycosyltransferase family 4 protein [Oleiagrimonas sp. MCCC 1A03011]|uniref:glycosyltransferase family 4 protein n=1 Tax=Oleiagrimonas sp. MCCC 1A03011 TaxID=1926883 RepID=UPI000DC4E9F4|nr:glycosyltransferase family 4 protein [Oleiagrimonas sp. MCCC 1A03011]RAP58296.1 glycosyl transferase family 1 [Oleiagrimonas sp. MCCC 1A03011]